MQIVAGICHYFIWISPFILVANIIGAMKAIKEERSTDSYVVIGGLSLLMIVLPIYYSSLYN